jgi:hypothetical protein
MKNKNRRKCRECGEYKYPSKMIRVDYGEVAYLCDWKCLYNYSKGIEQEQENEKTK